MTMVTIKDVPQNLREQIIQEFQATNDRKDQVVELTQQLTDANTLIAEMQSKVQASLVREFDNALDAKIAELINWQVKGEEGQKALDAFRRTLKSHILAEMGSERKAERIAEIAGQVWTTLQPLAETLRNSLAGPAAIVGNRQRTDDRKLDISPDAIAKAHASLGW